MSNAKQRAIDALGATFSAIEGISREAAFQSAAYVVEELIASMGPCTHRDCRKYNHGHPGNCNNPSPCLYHTVAPVRAALKSKVLLESMMGVFINGVKPLGCLETCYTESCEYKDKLHPTCYAYAVCLGRTKHPGPHCGPDATLTVESTIEWAERLHVERIAPPEPCNEPCENSECMNNGEGDKCQNHGLCEDHIEPEAPDVLQGYTLAQWGEIRAGGYLCQFSNDGESWTKGGRRLGDIELKSSLKFAEGREDTTMWWAYCRPAELPGVLRPWFGGDCPVSADIKVLVVYNNGAADVDSAGRFATWGPNVGGPRIVAFMALP